MTLSEFGCGICRVSAVGGDDAMHRRLSDLGLLGAEIEVRYKRGSSALVDIIGGGRRFSAVVSDAAAKNIIVGRGHNESSALRKPQRRQNNTV